MICLYKETILVSGYLTWQDEGPKTTSPIEAENANGIDSLPISGKGFMATGFTAFEGRLAARVLLQGFSGHTRLIGSSLRLFLHPSILVVTALSLTRCCLSLSLPLPSLSLPATSYHYHYPVSVFRRPVGIPLFYSYFTDLISVYFTLELGYSFLLVDVL